jgi:hypothetical protein
MRRKDAGFAEKLLPVLLSTGIVFGIVLLSGQFMEVYRAREHVNQIARAYLLEMETMGYLNSSAVNSLEETLENAGVTEVSLEGTTNNPGNYGESIRLVIEGKLCTTVKVAIPFLYKANKEWKIPIRIDMYSTSKH